jgi:hypothetical protein
MGSASREGGVGGSGGAGDASISDRLLRERSGISSSMRGMSDVLGQAMEAKSALLGQRGMMGGASTGLATMFRKMPSFSKMVDSVSRKKNRDNAIVAAVVGCLLLFTLWWLFLR